MRGGGVTLTCSDRKTKSEHGVENGEGKDRRERGKEGRRWMCGGRVVSPGMKRREGRRRWNGGHN